LTTIWQSSAAIEVSQAPGTLILHLCGELDIATREIIEPIILDAVSTAYSVILDLAELTFCDSSGLALFLAAHEKAQAEGTRLTLGHLQPNVERAVAASGIDQTLNIA
jgi:anti-sigma B factor antagonist